MSKEEESLKANRSSPDLSHTVEVQAGDTLPLLCHRIYKDAAYYPEVARANNIVDFRTLKPGLRLHFPPLI
jgi:nucleoid-associated protein YgaU